MTSISAVPRRAQGPRAPGAAEDARTAPDRGPRHGDHPGGAARAQHRRDVVPPAQLAQHGFVVEDAERGNGRDRWWRAAHDSTKTGASALDDPAEEDREALDAFGQAIAVLYTEQMQHAIDERMSLPAEWRRATVLSDWMMRLTPARARALIDALRGHRRGHTRGGRRGGRRRVRGAAAGVPAPGADLVIRRRTALYGWLTSEAISLTGTRVSMIALPWFVLTTTGSATQTGLVALAELVPLVLLKVLGGPVIDRVGARRVSVTCDLASVRRRAA